MGAVVEGVCSVDHRMASWVSGYLKMDGYYPDRESSPFSTRWKSLDRSGEREDTDDTLI